MAPRRNATTPARIALAKKERRALELRKGGATYNRIAQALGYSDEGGAAKAVKRALADTLQEPAAEMRRLEAERLDAMQSALWPAALSGKWLAVDRCLGIMERRARLLAADHLHHERLASRVVDACDEAEAGREHKYDPGFDDVGDDEEAEGQREQPIDALRYDDQRPLRNAIGDDAPVGGEE